MFCSKCGSQNADDAKFCVSCAAPLNQDAQPVEPAPQMTYQQTVYEQPNVTPDLPGKGMGITSMILGIVSVVFMCYCFIAIPCGVAALILGIISSKKASEVGLKNGFALAGIITSSIGIGLSLILTIAFFSCAGCEACAACAQEATYDSYYYY